MLVFEHLTCSQETLELKLESLINRLVIINAYYIIDVNDIQHRHYG
jgi:hypothetical protein